MKRKYSILTTSPLDRDDKKRFLKFRTESMLNDLKTVTYCWGIAWIVNLVLILVNPAYLQIVITFSLILASQILILLFSRFSKQGYIYLIPIQFTIILVFLNVF